MGTRKKLFVAAVCVAAIGIGPSAAFAGEVIGPPGSIGHPGTPKDVSHANSICVFSGLNDFVDGPMDFHVQSYGQDVRKIASIHVSSTPAMPVAVAVTRTTPN